MSELCSIRASALVTCCNVRREKICPYKRKLNRSPRKALGKRTLTTLYRILSAIGTPYGDDQSPCRTRSVFLKPSRIYLQDLGRFQWCLRLTGRCRYFTNSVHSQVPTKKMCFDSLQITCQIFVYT